MAWTWMVVGIIAILAVYVLARLLGASSGREGT